MDNQTYTPDIFDFKNNIKQTPAETDETFSRRRALYLLLIHIANYFVITTIIGSFVYLIFEALKEPLNINDSIIEATVQTLCYIVMLATVIPFTYKSIIKDFKDSLKKPLFLILMSIGLFVAFLIITTLYSSLIESNIINFFVKLNIISKETYESYQTSINQQTIVALFDNKYSIMIFVPTLVIIGPLYEEIIFRKAFFRLLNFKNPVLNIVISGAIFGAIHVISPLLLVVLNLLTGQEGYKFDNIFLELIFFFNYFLSGVLLGIIYNITGHKIVPVYIVHLLNNLLVAISVIVAF